MNAAAGGELRIPSAYAPRHALARSARPELADLYLRHVTVGDPPADAAIRALSGRSADDRQRFLDAGLRSNASLLAKAPPAVRDFFDSALDTPPDPFDRAAVRHARSVFHSHPDIFIQAFVVATLQNLSTLMAVAPAITGVYASGHALRPLRYAARHFYETMLPGSLEGRGTAWKLSLHIRLVHAAARASLQASSAWDSDRYGTPIHAAHLGLGAANYSAGTLRYAARLGAPLDAQARRGFMQIRHYASLLLGTPPALLFEADEARTRAFAETAHLCEPPPGRSAAEIAGTVIRGLPAIANAPNSSSARRLVARAHRISRALLPRETCDALGFPRANTAGVLPYRRFRRALLGAWFRANPSACRRWKSAQAEFFANGVLPGDPDYTLPQYPDRPSIPS